MSHNGYRDDQPPLGSTRRTEGEEWESGEWCVWLSVSLSCSNFHVLAVDTEQGGTAQEHAGGEEEEEDGKPRRDLLEEEDAVQASHQERNLFISKSY